MTTYGHSQTRILLREVTQMLFLIYPKLMTKNCPSTLEFFQSNQLRNILKSDDLERIYIALQSAQFTSKNLVHTRTILAVSMSCLP